MLLRHHAAVDLSTNDKIRDTKNTYTWPSATEMHMFIEHKAVVELPTNENSWYYHYFMWSNAALIRRNSANNAVLSTQTQHAEKREFQMSHDFVSRWRKDQRSKGRFENPAVIGHTPTTQVIFLLSRV